MSAEFAPRASVEPTIEVSDEPDSEADPLLSVDANGEASGVVSTEGTEVETAEVVSTEVVSAELVSAEELGAELVSAELVSAELVSAEELGAELLSEDVAGAADVSTEGTVTTTELAKGPAVATGEDRMGSSAIELPNFRPRRFGRATLALFAGCAAVFVVASVAWNRSSSGGEPIAERSPERAPELTPAGPSREPAPASAAPATNASTTSLAHAPEKPVGKVSLDATAAVTVTVTALPEGAVIFQAGKRLGTGAVRVSIEPKMKQRFTALLDGYAPSNFALDGSRDAVTIVLKRIQRRRVTTTAASDSPYDSEPNADTMAVTAPATAAAAAPESTAEGAIEPVVPSAETSSE
jgi:hypothetical protein